MTLIELSIALILFSLLILPVFIMQNKQAETEKRGKTIATLSTLDAALERFVITHGRYPMPGQRNLDLNDPEAGREFSGEVDDLKECGPDTAEVCTLSSLIDDGNPNTDDLKEAAVLRGEFPYATLGLPPTAVLDGFGNKITYFITSAQTKNATYENDGGQIQIRNKANPDEILMAGDKVHFALMSAGPNGVGAYTLHGALRTTCGGGADEADDDEGGAGEEESAGPGNGPDNGPGETGINCVHPKEENKVKIRF
ncbi:MAG: type II secretion system GspH family protein [Alphaproteobacteria bacterium]|nr:type II secretion system GspH family protein [Alphaproteobacteria bacterium]